MAAHQTVHNSAGENLLRDQMQSKNIATAVEHTSIKMVVQQRGNHVNTATNLTILKDV
jgi:hypothetical protein